MSSWYEKIETWFFVTIITALIWLYAEGQNVRPQDLNVAVKMVAAPGQDLLISPTGPLTVRVTVRCSQSQLNNLRDELRGPIDLELTASEDQPVVDVDLRERLSRAAQFANLGVPVTQVDPARVPVTVEEMVARPVEVKVSPPDGVELAGGVSVDPARAVVRLPERYAEGISGRAVTAELDGRALAGMEVDVPHSLTVPLTLPPGVPPTRATIDPAAVRVTFTIRKQTESYTLTNVPVMYTISPILTRRFDVTVAPEHLFVRDVKVSGPGDQIERLRSGDFRVTAELRLSADDLEKGIESVQPFIDLPAGVRLETPIQRVPITVRPRP